MRTERLLTTVLTMLAGVVVSCVRADSRIGYESSNHYFFIPQDLREKILTTHSF